MGHLASRAGIRTGLDSSPARERRSVGRSPMSTNPTMVFSFAGYENICVIKYDDTFADDPEGIALLNADHRLNARRAFQLFHQNHGDVYDLVTIITDTSTGMPDCKGGYKSVYNDVRGIGQDESGGKRADLRAIYGTQHLEGIWSFETAAMKLGAHQQMMLHEFGHRWSAYAKYRDRSDGPDLDDHIDPWSHWRTLLLPTDTSAFAVESVMNHRSATRWRERLPDIFTRQGGYGLDYSS